MRAPPQKTNGLLFDDQWCLISSSRLVYDIMAALRGRCRLFFWWVFIEFTRGTHEEKRSRLQWMNEWMNEEPRMRGQQTCLLTIHFNMWTVSSDVSIQRRHWQPPSVHLWAYCTHPTHDRCEWCDVRRLTTTQGSTSPTLFEQWCGFFYVPQEPDKCKCCETGPTVFRPYPRRLESLTVCRCHYKGSTFFSVI